MELKEFSSKVDEWDQKVIIKYNGLGGKPLTIIFRFLSFFGKETLWLCLIAFYLVIWYDPFLLSYISATFLTGLILILLIKQTIKRKRPFERLEEGKITVYERKPSSRSFPSWHSYNIMAHGLLFGIIFLKSPIISVLVLIIVFIVSFSRIQLGVHYPSDVIFGSIFGILGFLLTIYLTGPLIFKLVTYLEQFILVEIQYQQINPLLLNNIGYLFFSLGIFLIIFLLAINKSIIALLKKNKLKV
ncbi:MAG: phosphatase PAP2 family protein [Candidatus Thorarchaeota archaeon]